MPTHSLASAFISLRSTTRPPYRFMLCRLLRESWYDMEEVDAVRGGRMDSVVVASSSFSVAVMMLLFTLVTMMIRLNTSPEVRTAFTTDSWFKRAEGSAISPKLSFTLSSFPAFRYSGSNYESSMENGPMRLKRLSPMRSSRFFSLNSDYV